MAYKNIEGYSDPTAGEAISNAMREYKRERRAVWSRENEIRERPKVYVVSPYAGDVENNVAAAIRYCQFAIDQKKMPIASHLLYPQMLDDNSPAQREIGTMFGLALIPLCKEVWVFGDNITPGMQREIHEARRKNIKLRFFNGEMEEIR